MERAFTLEGLVRAISLFKNEYGFAQQKQTVFSLQSILVMLLFIKPL